MLNLHFITSPGVLKMIVKMLMLILFGVSRLSGRIGMFMQNTVGSEVPYQTEKTEKKKKVKLQKFSYGGKLKIPQQSF